MKKLNQVLVLSVIFAGLQPRIAFARGGSCGESVFCTITGLAIGLILLIIFLPPLFVDIKDKGFIKGLAEHLFASYFVILFGMLMLFFILSN
jgi:hypothetical protein